jgi:hypothetical protein
MHKHGEKQAMTVHSCSTDMLLTANNFLQGACLLLQVFAAAKKSRLYLEKLPQVKPHATVTCRI